MDPDLDHEDILEQYKTKFQPFLKECDIIDRFGALFKKEYYHFVSLQRLKIEKEKSEASEKKPSQKRMDPRKFKHLLHGFDDEIDLNMEED